MFAFLGISVGFVVMLMWIPLPKFRILFSLMALGFLVIGVDFIAVTPVEAREGAGPAIASLIGGLLAGVGLGYFFKWIRDVMREPRTGAE
ncbi:MAG: hypothetical protein H7A51_13880 [Akkermansiaceae bacterium]|nr:hypothetical protein [Akkermansiaceae bacterium]